MKLVSILLLAVFLFAPSAWSWNSSKQRKRERIERRKCWQECRRKKKEFCFCTVEVARPHPSVSPNTGVFPPPMTVIEQQEADKRRASKELEELQSRERIKQIDEACRNGSIEGSFCR